MAAGNRLDREDLGLGYYRVTQRWEPGRSQAGAADAASVAAALRNAGSQKVLLSVFGPANAAPVGLSSRTAYCSFVSSLLDRFPQVAAVNIWNEANLSYFWKPQFGRKGSSAAPGAYAALLARCYDAIKTRHPSVRVITSISPRGNDNPRARSNVSHSPGNFISKLGQAYGRSHRHTRIFDAWGQNVYGASSKERPWARHRVDIGQGDYPRLLSYLKSAFGGDASAGSRPEGRSHLVPRGRLPDERRRQALLLREQRDRPLRRRASR